MNVLQSWWDDLRAHTVPPDASAEQVRDMRIAFLIGVRESLVFIGQLKRTPANERIVKDLVAEVGRSLIEIAESLPPGEKSIAWPKED